MKWPDDVYTSAARSPERTAAADASVDELCDFLRVKASLAGFDLEDALAKLTLEAVHSVDDLHLWDKSDLVSCLPRTTAIKIYKAVAGSVHMASVHVDSDTTR